MKYLRTLIFRDVAPQNGLAPAAGAAEAVTEHDVEAELARWSLVRLPFSPSIEARYEADTKQARALVIRITVPMGLAFYNAFTLVDSSMLPDLGWIPLVFRLGVITPVGLFAMWMCTRASARFREAFISIAITGTLLIPLGFIAVSRAPLAPYMMLVVLLVSMFGNITMRLRFHWACLFTVATLLATGLMLVLRSDLVGGLALHIGLATVTCASFGIVVNNQLERAERRSFLMNLREVLRSRQLSADKATFSALSLVDPLTGLANRRAFDARLGTLWQSRKTNGRDFALLMIDVDYFKPFNDFYGHPAGDACLDRVGGCLREIVVRGQDLVARYGGEEFAVLLADCNLASAVQMAERLRRSVRKDGIAHANRDDSDKMLSVSIGVAASEDHGVPDTAALLALADRRLYEAKRAGRNQVFPSTQAMEEETAVRQA